MENILRAQSPIGLRNFERCDLGFLSWFWHIRPVVVIFGCCGWRAWSRTIFILRSWVVSSTGSCHWAKIIILSSQYLLGSLSTLLFILLSIYCQVCISPRLRSVFRWYLGLLSFVLIRLRSNLRETISSLKNWLLLLHNPSGRGRSSRKGDCIFFHTVSMAQRILIWSTNGSHVQVFGVTVSSITSFSNFKLTCRHLYFTRLPLPLFVWFLDIFIKVFVKFFDLYWINIIVSATGWPSSLWCWSLLLSYMWLVIVCLSLWFLFD